MPEPRDIALRAGRMEGRSCVVTGSGSGIGRATTLRFAQEGGHVVAVDIDGEAASGTAKLAADLHAGTVLPFTADVSDREQVRAYLDLSISEFGGVDVLVNNAAVNLPGLFHEATAEDIHRTVAVNIMGAVHSSQLAIPHMLESGGGSIVNVASVNALVAEKYLSIYAMSKGALAMLTRGVALDYAALGIRCNAVCPGWVDTPINHAHAEMLGGLDEVYRTIDSFQPIGRPGQPEEIANLILFLASDEASFITGSVMVADGGLTSQ